MSETELVIQRVTNAALDFIGTKDAREATNALLAAIDAAMSHAYAEGRADEAEERNKEAA